MKSIQSVLQGQMLQYLPIQSNMVILPALTQNQIKEHIELVPPSEQHKRIRASAAHKSHANEADKDLSDVLIVSHRSTAAAQKHAVEMIEEAGAGDICATPSTPQAVQLHLFDAGDLGSQLGGYGPVATQIDQLISTGHAVVYFWRDANPNLGLGQKVWNGDDTCGRP